MDFYEIIVFDSAGRVDFVRDLHDYDEASARRIYDDIVYSFGSNFSYEFYHIELFDSKPNSMSQWIKHDFSISENKKEN